MVNKLALRSFRVRNFKAIQDSGTLRFTPLTVLIGNNGSGKSSLIEALEAFQTLYSQGLDAAMAPWLGIEYIWNQSVPHGLKSTRKKPEREELENPIQFDLLAHVSGGQMRLALQLNASKSGNELFVASEKGSFKKKGDEDYIWTRDSLGNVTTNDGLKELRSKVRDGNLFQLVPGHISMWQFVSLNPQNMGRPIPQQRSSQYVKLARDGSNIGEYLHRFREDHPDAFGGFVEALKYVLPYAVDLQPTLTSELERSVYVQLAEGNFKLPGWVLSTGTMRIMALLALLRHPDPPPLIVIEEIENGLDPRTINLIVDEIRTAIQSGRTQVILTTHSPYLLDLLLLEHIVLVQRDETTGAPVFYRPSDDKTLADWVKEFTPGQLYTMGRLNSLETK